jgi:heterodisulfide reductase subunit A
MTADERTILVVGGGIAGTAIALHIAGAGHRAIVIDEAPVVGGALLLLDKTYPTDSCGVCFMAPDPPAVCPFLECERNPLIEIRPSTQLVGLKGDAGAFEAEISISPRFVDPQRCNACGECSAVCPVDVQAGHLGAGWLNEKRKAIYLPFPQSVPMAYVLDAAACNRCGDCMKVCPRGAIDLEQQARQEIIHADAIVLSPGFGPNDAHVRGSYGYGEYSNVISSLEYERMLSTSSPSRGRPVRPSDGQDARRVAIVQCAGSRDRSCGVPYCSSACCMIAAKQASLTKQRAPEAEVTVFTMDVRAAGRGYERYLAGVKELPGVVYRRSLISGVKLDPQTASLSLQFAEGGRAATETFDLVILDVGMVVPQAIQQMAQGCGIEIDTYGFAVTTGQAPVDSSRPGVFVAGSFREPKDVATTVAEAISAAARALQAAGAAPRPVEDLPAGQGVERSFYDAPILGVFLDGSNPDLAEAIDIEELATAIAEMPDVAVVAKDSSERKVAQAIAKHHLTHVIIGSVSARRGRDDCPWVAGVPVTRVGLGATDVFVHQDNPAAAQGKAVELIRMAVQAARYARPQTVQGKMPEQRALVVGGDVAGLMAAHTLSAMGIQTDLIVADREIGLGWESRAAEASWLDAIRKQIAGDTRITTHTASRLIRCGGTAGQMVSTIATADGEIELVHGAAVLALGARENRPAGFDLEERANVITQGELGQLAKSWAEAGSQARIPASIAMLQCAGMRDAQHLYCSRTCCIDALRNALAVKELAPATQIAVVFRDIVTPGFSEDLYQRAREMGILFLRHAAEHPPQLEDGSLSILDDVLGEEVFLKPELIVLSTGIVPHEDNRALADMMGLELDGDGFLSPINMKSQPLDFARPGIYMAGLVGGPATLEEVLEQGLAAGLRAGLFLGRPLLTPSTVARVDERICVGCGVCVTNCPVEARHIDLDEGVAKVDTWLCLGCGVCAAVCPNGASSIALYEAGGVLSAINAALG